VSYNNNELQMSFDFTGEVPSTSFSSSVKREGAGAPPSLKPIFLAGDYMVDEWHVVKQDGDSAEADIPRWRETEVVYCPGGAGNVRKNLEALGATVVGPKPTIFEQVPTKVRYVTKVGNQVLRVDKRDYCTPQNSGIIKLAFEHEGIGAVVVSDYCKGSITPDVRRAMVQLAMLNHCPLVVDTKDNPNLWPATLTVFLPNYKEYKQFEHEYNKMPFMILKLGKQGAQYVQEGSVKDWSPSLNKSPKSVCGAGDVVAASVGVSMAWGFSVPQAMHTAMIDVGKAMNSRFTCLVKN